MERQKHGFIYQDNFIVKHNLIKDENYTSKYDAYINDKNKTPVKIKYIQSGCSIDMSDFFINSEEEKDFILVISFWESEKDNTIYEKSLYINIEKWKLLFSNFSYFQEMKDWIKNKVKNSYEYDSAWKSECNFYKKEWNKTERKIALRFKRDHKTQRRIQCAINISDWYSFFIREFEEFAF